MAKEYIERKRAIVDACNSLELYPSEYAELENALNRIPAADVVSKGLYEQIKWERDVALAQLEEYGVSLGEKADVVEVRHGRWKSTGVLVGLMNFEYFYRCTACGRRGGDTKTNYCPHCGALMDKEK